MLFSVVSCLRRARLFGEHDFACVPALARPQPFNSYFVAGGFCSAFPDLDRLVSSQGSFFENDFVEARPAGLVKVPDILFRAHGAHRRIRQPHFPRTLAQGSFKPLAEEP